MQINITGRTIEVTDALKNYIEKKFKKLSKYLLEPIDIHLTLAVEGYRNNIEAVVNAKGVTLKAQGEMEDMYAAIDNVCDKILKQAKKHKEKIQEHKKNLHLPQAMLEEMKTEEEEKYEVVETETILPKPMSIDEAVMQLKVLDRDFFIFKNAETNRLNIIYKRRSGNLGLIEI